LIWRRKLNANNEDFETKPFPTPSKIPSWTRTMVRVKISKTETTEISIKGTTGDPVSKRTIRETVGAPTVTAEIFDYIRLKPTDSDTMTTAAVDTEEPKTPISPLLAGSKERTVVDLEEVSVRGTITTVVITIIAKISTMGNDHSTMETPTLTNGRRTK